MERVFAKLIHLVYDLVIVFHTLLSEYIGKTYIILNPNSYSLLIGIGQKMREKRHGVIQAGIVK